MLERRKYPRFELKVKATYKLMSDEEAFKLGTMKNISAEGLCFESHEKLDKGSHVNLKVDLGDSMPPISLIGEIRWSKEIKVQEERYINGVKLIDIHKSDENRFLKYYCDKMVEKLSGYLKM